MKQLINKPVNITAVGFKKGTVAYPRRMELDGRDYEFVDAGLSFIARKGEQIVQIMTMTDGRSQFRLRSDNRSGLWTLLDITA